MQKIAGLVFVLFMPSAFIANAGLTHLERLKSRYPYGLIGDDYGLLTEEDLAVNTCNVSELTPFSGDKNMAYSYWQCFPLKDTKIECERAGYDPTVKKETAYLEISAQNESGLQSFLARNARAMRECRQFLLQWERKTRDEQYVCISGSYGGVTDTKDGRKEADWVFDKFKTRKGCVSKGVGCSLKELSSLHHCVLPAGFP